MVGEHYLKDREKMEFAYVYSPNVRVAAVIQEAAELLFLKVMLHAILFFFLIVPPPPEFSPFPHPALLLFSTLPRMPAGVGGLFFSFTATSAMVARVPAMERWRPVVPHCTMATGVESARPWPTSVRAIS